MTGISIDHLIEGRYGSTNFCSKYENRFDSMIRESKIEISVKFNFDPYLYINIFKDLPYLNFEI